MDKWAHSDRSDIIRESYPPHCLGINHWLNHGISPDFIFSVCQKKKKKSEMANGDHIALLNQQDCKAFKWKG